MKSHLLRSRGLFIAYVFGAAAAAILSATGLHAKSAGWNADSLTSELANIKKLPALPDGVAELKFSDFYKFPAGPCGLEYSDKLKQLNGRRVRILGFMVEQERPSRGVAMLTPYRETTDEEEYGLCDDLPPATIFAVLPKYQDAPVPYTPGPLLLTGILEVGKRIEADGRVSHVRLLVDPESTPASTTARSATVSTKARQI
ncbi:MAG TPA: hypothetical protein VFT72_19470 [Opitutaceae bacterium]|nr:hypothetical protein [Opitutaceae bacterium]